MIIINIVVPFLHLPMFDLDESQPPPAADELYRFDGCLSILYVATVTIENEHQIKGNTFIREMKLVCK